MSERRWPTITATQLMAMDLGPAPADLPCGLHGKVLAVLNEWNRPRTLVEVQEDLPKHTRREVGAALSELVRGGAVRRTKSGRFAIERVGRA